MKLKPPLRQRIGTAILAAIVIVNVGVLVWIRLNRKPTCEEATADFDKALRALNRFDSTLAHAASSTAVPKEKLEEEHRLARALRDAEQKEQVACAKGKGS